MTTKITSVPKRRRRRHRGGDVAFSVGSQSAMTAWTVMIVIPLLWTVMSSFKTNREILASPLGLPSRWSFDNYVAAWTKAHIGEFFFNSLIVVSASVILVMLLGAMCAYVLATFEFPGRQFIVTVLIGSMAFPGFLAIVPLFRLMMGFGLTNSLFGLVVVYVVFALPFTVFFLHGFFKALPRDLYEAAQIDGAGHWGTFFRVMLPMALPGLGTVGLFNFCGLWNQYLLPLVLVTDRDKFVLTQGMMAFAQQAGRAVDYGAIFAGAVMSILPILVIYIIFQRQLTGSISQGSFR